MTTTERVLRSIEIMCRRGYLTAPEFLGQLKPALPGAVTVGCKVLGIKRQEFRSRLYAKTIGAFDFFPRFMVEYEKWLKQNGGVKI